MIHNGHSSQGLKTTHNRSRIRATLDANFQEADMRKLQWYARKEGRSTASLIRHIVKEWIAVEELAGEFKGFRK